MRVHYFLLSTLFLFFGLVGCRKDIREAVDADIWLMDHVPSCVGIENAGIYRKVKCYEQDVFEGRCNAGDEFYEEFLPYCDRNIENYIAMHKDDFRKWSEFLVRECK